MVYYIFRLCKSSGGWEIVPKGLLSLNLPRLAGKFEKVNIKTKVILSVEVDGVKANIYPSGRIIIYDCGEEEGEKVGGKIFRIISESQDKERTALFVGRFQPFHMGHFKVMRDIVGEFGKIVIVIAGPETEPTLKDPFTFEERKIMINYALNATGMTNFVIHVLKDVNDDDKWSKEIRKLGSFDAAFTRNEWTARCLRSIGIPIKKQKSYERYKHCGTKIRERIKKGKDWRDLVPENVYDYIRKIGGEERIRKL